MKVRVFRPSKTAMQSGRARTGAWVLEPELATPRRPEPLMGWTSSGDTLNQIRLEFADRDEAVAFAVRKGWDYVVIDPAPRRIAPRNYADNFRTDRPE